ncbi:hypothetical protein HAX54_039822, partial [Datura stramonium]|nr:hypothetical protein [Datura stramonium]
SHRNLLDPKFELDRRRQWRVKGLVNFPLAWVLVGSGSNTVALAKIDGCKTKLVENWHGMSRKRTWRKNLAKALSVIVSLLCNLRDNKLCDYRSVVSVKKITPVSTDEDENDLSPVDFNTQLHRLNTEL